MCVRMNCNSNGRMFKIKTDRNLRRVYLQTSLIPFSSISKLLQLVIASYKNIILNFDAIHHTSMDSSNIIDYVKSNAKQLNKPKSIRTGHKLMLITFKAF